jgi:cysteine synthase
MAENFSVERRKLMRFLGAKVVLTPAAQKGSGMLAKAIELAETHGWFLSRQFENEANADMHSRTTAREILDDFEGQRLDYWVTGFGTGGTLKGVARVLKAARPETRIVVCEPDNSPLLGSGIPQPRDAAGAVTGSHPSFRPHLMQGWSPDFVARLAEDAVAMHLVDRIVPVSGEEAMRMSRELARREGIFSGISGGATLAGALEVARGAPAGSAVLCMLPDTGERYLSTPLFADVSADMNDDELGHLSLHADGSLRCAAARRPRGSGRCAARRQSRRRGLRRRCAHRPDAAGGHVRAHVVRVLLVGPQDVRAAGDPVPGGRPGRGRDAAGRSRWRDSRRAEGADDVRDHPADLRRR